MDPQSKKDQVKHGKIWWYHVPTHFPTEAIILRSYPWCTPPRPEIYPQNLSTQHLVVWGSKKSRRKGWDYSNFTKGETFLVSLKQSAICSSLTLHYSCLTSFLQFGQVENIRGHLFEKICLVCFSPLSPQAEQKEDDEHFANHLQMYVSRTFTKAKKSVICSEYPMSSKFHLSKWKTYFSQFIDKFLKIEEVEYLIHYVKFKM